MSEETVLDTVYAITDYYDYPRSGIANLKWTPKIGPVA